MPFLVRVGESRLAAIGAATAVAMFSLVVFARSGWMLYPIMGVLAVATGLAIPSLTSLLAHRSPQRIGGTMGAAQALLSLAMIVGPAAAGAAHQAFGPSAPYWMGAGFALAALLLMLRARE
jgi:predicted MFS family arabinose efflux permease